jgi:tetratricopeptide (TPR) repeat protein
MSRKNQRRIGKQRLANKQANPLWLIPLVVVVAAIGIALLFVSPQSPRQIPVERSAGETETRSFPATNNPEPSAALPASNTVQVVDLSSTASTSNVSDGEKSAYYQNLGSKLLEKGRYADAIEQYRKAIKLNPDDEDSHYNLGLALAKAGDSTGARKEYEEALRISPEHPEAHMNLGNLLAAERKFDEAISHFKMALQSTPEDPAIHNDLGNALARQGKLPEAISAFEAALKLKPDYAEAHYNVGQAYLLRKETLAAIHEFSEALKLQPDYEPAQRGLAKARQIQGQ